MLMVSVEYIENKSLRQMKPSQRLARTSYSLAKGIRVRDEKFGLLFYNPKGPKLTFVHSGSWIQAEFFSGNAPLRQWLRRRFPAVSDMKILQAENRLATVLSQLAERGLIVETLADP